MTRSGVAAIVLAAWLGAAHATDGSFRLPLHDYVYVTRGSAPTPADILARLRDGLIQAIAEMGLAGAGYPRPCHIVQTPDPGNPRAMQVDCVERAGTAATADGILLDAEGHHVQLAIVTFPDSRLYMMEVFLVPGHDRMTSLPRRPA